MRKLALTWLLLFLFISLVFVKYNQHKKLRVWEDTIDFISIQLALLIEQSIIEDMCVLEQRAVFQGSSVSEYQYAQRLISVLNTLYQSPYQVDIERMNDSILLMRGIPEALNKFNSNRIRLSLYDSLSNSKLKKLINLASKRELTSLIRQANQVVCHFNIPSLTLSGMQDSYRLNDTLKFTLESTITSTRFGEGDLFKQMKIQDSIYTIKDINYGILEHHFTAEKGTHRVPVQMIVETECGLDTIQKTYTVNVH